MTPARRYLTTAEAAELGLDYMPNKWVRRWNTLISSNPVTSGVWIRKAGGFLVRGRTTLLDGTMKEVRLVLHSANTAEEAKLALDIAIAATKRGEDLSKIEKLCVMRNRPAASLRLKL